MPILEGKVEGERNRGRPNIYLEKDVEDWMEASFWRVGGTADDRLEDTSKQQRPEMEKLK